MATSKLSYANIRAAQRKNKSMHEVKDLLPKNLYSNFSNQNSQSPQYPLDINSKAPKDYHSRIKGTYTLFEEPSGGERQQLYSKSLFGRSKEEPLRHEEKLVRGHARVKSSITEMYHKNPEIPEEDESASGGATLTRFEMKAARSNNGSLYETENVGGTGGRLEEDQRIMREKWKENIRLKEERGLEVPGQTKEGRMLSDFLKRDGGFAKENASPEELRPRKKELSPEQDQGEEFFDKRNGIVKLIMDRSNNVRSEDVWRGKPETL